MSFFDIDHDATLEVLNSNEGPNDPLGSEKVRSVLKAIVAERASVIRAVDEFIKDDEVSRDLKQQIDSSIPVSSGLSKLSKEPLSNMLLDVFRIFCTFMIHKGDDRVLRVFHDVDAILKNVKSRIDDKKIKAGQNAYVTGDQAEKQRNRYLFHQGNVPLEALKLCVACNHNAVDEPFSNLGVATRNLAAQSIYNEASADLEREKERNPNCKKVFF